jgi:hypothetical protein
MRFPKGQLPAIDNRRESAGILNGCTGAKAATREGMYQCIELAGFAAAQAVCCLFDRILLLPLAFTRRASGPPTVGILAVGAPAEIIAHGHHWLDANVDKSDAAVVVCDGYVTIAGSKKDALVLDLQSYRPHAARMKMAVPYRPHHHDGGFAVHRPKFIVSAIEGHDLAALTDAFFRGVSSHDLGARIWKSCADQWR